MNHRYLFLALLLTLLTCLGASATNTTVTLTEGEAYVTKYDYTEKAWIKVMDLQVGDNTVDVPGLGTVRINPAEGYAVVSFKKNGTQEMGPDGGKPGSSIYGTLPTYINNMSSTDLAPKYILTVKKINELPRNTLTITIDDPTDVTCTLYQSSTPVTLIRGVNTVSYIPTFDETLRVMHNNWQQFYSITLNGKDQPTSPPVLIPLSDGADIKVNVNHPVSEYNYTLTYDEEDNFWTDIKVNGQTVVPVDNKFTAAAGATVELYNRNANDWFIKRIWTPDGIEHKGNYIGVDRLMLDPDYPITFPANCDGDIRVKAHKISDFHVTLNITGLEYLNVVNGSYTDNVPLNGLKEGKNELTVNEMTSRITIYPKEGNYLAPVTYRYTPDGEIMEAYYSRNPYYYTFVEGEVKDGIEIFIEGRKDIETFPITVNVNNPQDVGVYAYYDTFGRYPSQALDVTKEGDNIVNFPVTQNVLYVRPSNETCTISSVTYRTSADAEPQDAAFNELHNLYTVNDPQEGMIVTIVADHMVFDHSCTVYVDNVAAVYGGLTVVSPAGRVTTLQSGYNTVGFNADENDGENQQGFAFTVQNTPPAFYMFHNNEMLETATEKTFVAPLVEGDIYKVYLQTTDPRFYKVTFNKKGAVEFTDVTTDKVTPVTEIPADGLRLLPGTLVSFKIKNDGENPAKVTVGRDELEAVDGVYTFTVTDSSIGVNAVGDELDAIETIDATMTDAAAVIYDLNGRRVNGTPAPGLYIRVVAGEASKVLVK